METSGSLDGVIVSILDLNARDVGLIPTLDTIFCMFIVPTTPVAVTRILYKLQDERLWNLPYVCERSWSVCIKALKDLQFQEDICSSVCSVPILGAIFPIFIILTTYIYIYDRFRLKAP